MRRSGGRYCGCVLGDGLSKVEQGEQGSTGGQGRMGEMGEMGREENSEFKEQRREGKMIANQSTGKIFKVFLPQGEGFRMRAVNHFAT